MSLFKSEPMGVEVQGRELKCLICGHGSFLKREAQLNTAVLTFFSLDWANKSATCYVCGRCGFVHWFLPQ